MPASTNASYVGRFAPPGYPNTTSTPSAFRHSMTASTARIISAPSFPGDEISERPSLPACGGHGLGLDRHLRELELGPATCAQRVVELDDLAAPRALAAQLVAVVAVQKRREETGERDERRDQEPQE